MSSFAKDITEGKWELNGEAIKFNGDGRLLDGQHRLHACVLANKSFKALIVRGLPAISQETMDMGRKRSLSNILSMRGISHATFVSGMAVVLWHIKNETRNIIRVSPQTLLPIIERHQEGLVESARLCSTDPRIMGARPAAVGAIYFIGDYLMGDESNAIAFLEAFKKGESFYDDDAAIAVRERLIRLRQQGATVPGRAQLWGLTQAYNAFREELPVTKFTWPKAPVPIEGFDTDLI